MHKPYFPEVAVPRPADLNGGEWRVSKLTNVVAVFGKNGSGKSRLLRALRDNNLAGTHYVVAERTGEIDYQPQYMHQQMNASGRSAESQRNFSSEYRRHIVVRIQAYLTTRGNYRGTEAPPTSPEIIEEYLSLVLPDFVLTLKGTSNPPYELRRASNDMVISSINELSSGEAQILLLVIDILTIASMWEIEGNQQRLLLVDEPDAHVHPDLLVRFADFLFQATKHFKLQTIIATHSTALLAALGQFCGDQASVIYLDRTKQISKQNLSLRC